MTYRNWPTCCLCILFSFSSSFPYFLWFLSSLLEFIFRYFSIFLFCFSSRFMLGFSPFYIFLHFLILLFLQLYSFVSLLFIWSVLFLFLVLFFSLYIFFFLLFCSSSYFLGQLLSLSALLCSWFLLSCLISLLLPLLSFDSIHFILLFIISGIIHFFQFFQPFRLFFILSFLASLVLLIWIYNIAS